MFFKPNKVVAAVPCGNKVDKKKNANSQPILILPRLLPPDPYLTINKELMGGQEFYSFFIHPAAL